MRDLFEEYVVEIAGLLAHAFQTGVYLMLATLSTLKGSRE